MRHTRSHTANRRSHHALKAEALSICPNCKSPVSRHTVCKNCGEYRGRKIVNVSAAIEKKAKKLKKTEEKKETEKK
ncbi:MAG: 50S ribosomal protein L32 [Patescibacteria group bacterium]|nr:50S ribosomal protein L32 [bacterium]MDZ4240596.1 50S ribosomal protein L32 [Patescibacteria group bacterium]